MKNVMAEHYAILHVSVLIMLILMGQMAVSVVTAINNWEIFAFVILIMDLCVMAATSLAADPDIYQGQTILVFAIRMVISVVWIQRLLALWAILTIPPPRLVIAILRMDMFAMAVISHVAVPDISPAPMVLVFATQQKTMIVPVKPLAP